MSTSTRPRTADVLVAGGGVAGLVAAAELLRAGHSVLLVEADDRLGGRVKDVRRERRGQTLDGDAPALGAWGFTIEHEGLLKLVGRYGLERRPWSKRIVFTARGQFAKSAHELRRKAFKVPNSHPFAQLDEGNLDGHALVLIGAAMARQGHTQQPQSQGELAAPPCLADVVTAVFGSEAEEWLRCVSHRYAGIRREPLDFLTLSKSPASHATELHRIIGGFSALVDALWRELVSQRAFQHLLSTELTNVSEQSGTHNPAGSSRYLCTLRAANGGASSQCETHAVALCLPVQSLSRLVRGARDDLLAPLATSPHLTSCHGLSAFKAVAFYDEPWWSQEERTKEWLGEDKMLVACDSPLGLITCYSPSSDTDEQGGITANHAVHLSYSHDAVWGSRLANESDVYGILESELKRLFDPRGEQGLRIPPPTDFRAEWWDVGLHYPGFVEGYVSLRGRVDVQEWACTGPIAGHPTVVLAGEAVSANWGWVEGAVQTAQLAARTLNQRLSGKEGEQ